jgi:hypothetical protein
MEYPVHEADAGALVWVLVWELDVDLPETALEGRCEALAAYETVGGWSPTFYRALESNVEFLPKMCERCFDGCAMGR